MCQVKAHQLPAGLVAHAVDICHGIFRADILQQLQLTQSIKIAEVLIDIRMIRGPLLRIFCFELFYQGIRIGILLFGDKFLQDLVILFFINDRVGGLCKGNAGKHYSENEKQ